MEVPKQVGIGWMLSSDDRLDNMGMDFDFSRTVGSHGGWSKLVGLAFG